jgi:hypothetical protein
MPSTHVNHTRLQGTVRTTLSRCIRSSKPHQTVCQWDLFNLRDQGAQGIGGQVCLTAVDA